MGRARAFYCAVRVRAVQLRACRLLTEREYGRAPGVATGLAADAPPAGGLSILHVLRAPVGGLFRHVLDLVRGQCARGNRIGIVADASTGGTQADENFAQLTPHLALGLTRVPMSRQFGWRDLAARAHVARRAIETGADIVHGHGAKGGAYARLVASPRAARVYTPHGGSLHYSWNSPTGAFYLASERFLMGRTDLFLFESAYGREAFEAKIGKPRGLVQVVHNGVRSEEFVPIVADTQASDLVFVGELRSLKGVDVLIEAVAILDRAGKRISATVVGEGSERAAFEAFAAAQGVTASMRFAGAKPVRTAFALGHLLVVPSRAESLPYVVLEGAAAGIPMIVTRVGGIAEIFAEDADALVPAGDPQALAAAIAQALLHPAAARAMAQRLQSRVRAHFSVEVMTQAVLAAYLEALARRDS
jgi:glycosyltransferase involved in cell wall biosynthesis